MSEAGSRRGIKLVDLIVVLGVLGLLVCLLIPAVMTAREAARRCSCASTMKGMNLAMHSYENAHGHLPSSMLERPSGHFLTATGPVPGTDNSNGDGADFSWYAVTLRQVYDGPIPLNLDLNSGFPYDGDPNHVAAAAVPLASSCDRVRTGPEGRCASFVGPEWSEAPEYSPRSSAISNYVALGATHLASLYRTETRPIGGASHPNGTIYPGSETTFGDIADGASHTLVLCETRERSYAAWIDGTTAAVVGLAEQSRLAFVQRDGQAYYSPASGVRTTLNWGVDDVGRGQFYLPAADHSGSQPWIHGPSSFHPGIVNHAVADGCVRCVSDDIDPVVYMHLITRDGGEPVDKFFE